MCKKSVKPLVILLSFFLIGILTCLGDVQSQTYTTIVRSTEVKPVSTLVAAPVVTAITVDANSNRIRNQFAEGLANATKTQINSILGELPTEDETDSFVITEAVNKASEYLLALLPPIAVFSGNTNYEELMDVGLYPEKDLLAAVIAIKQQTGYYGDLCESGLNEYVTFWIDWNNDSIYAPSELIGVSAINVHDIANELRCSRCNNSYLYYGVTLKIPKPKKKWCINPNLVKVRAILSAGIPHLNPNTLPYYGNVMNRWVQINPLYFILQPIPIPEYLTIQPMITNLEIFPEPIPPIDWNLSTTDLLDPIYTGNVGLSEMIPLDLSEPDLLSDSTLSAVPYNGLNVEEEPIEEMEVPLEELKVMYEGKDVENGRIEYKTLVTEFSKQNTPRTSITFPSAATGTYSLTELASKLTTNTSATSAAIPLANPALLVNSNLVAQYPVLKLLGNTKYEELTYFGLDSSSDTMVAIIHVKRPYGYNGNLCSQGSREYVRFWIDWDCDGFDASDNIGATYVKVHDIEEIPDSGLYYAVRLNFVPKYRRHCNDINVYQARAILSWNVCPGLNPSFTYHWGNIQTRCVQVKPGWLGEGIYPFVDTIGRVQRESIDANGYANGQCGASTAVDAPFGGYITITGHIFNVPDFSQSNNTTIEYSPKVRYKFQYKKDGDTQWLDMLTPLSGQKFSISVTKFNHQAVNQEIITKNIQSTIDSDGFYPYYEDLKYTEAYPITQFVAENKLMHWNTTGLTDGKYQIRMVVKDNSTLIYSDTFYTIDLVLDNTKPFVSVAFDAGLGVCGKISAGTPINGKYTVYDKNIRYYQLWSTCGTSCSGGGTITTGNANVFNDSFSQDTTGFDSCGYSVNLQAWDRTIYNDSYGHRYGYTSEYFCLLDADEQACTSGCEEGQTRQCATDCGIGVETYLNGQWVNCTAPKPQREVCDGEDNDCDGQVDEGLIRTYYRDADGDGYGDPAAGIEACSALSGYVANNTDCNDTDRSVHPQAPEIPCNGKDDDCQGGDSTSPNCTTLVNVGQDSGALDIVETNGRIGTTIQVPVRIQSAPSAVHSLGFEVTYDPDILEFSGFKKTDRGALVKDFSMFEVNVAGPNRLRIGGYDAGNGIAKGASGEIVLLQFTVIGGQDDICYPLGLEALLDEVSDFSSTGGCFTLKSCDGDINKDGKITPSDALIAFRCYLGNGDCPDCVDVNDDGKISPADALCAFQKYLGQPSCLDTVK
ncbi:MAG: MopE-related protein [bacterium]